MKSSKLFLSAILTLSLHASLAFALVQCKPTEPYDNKSQGGVHKVLLYTPAGYAEAVKNSPRSEEIAQDENSFSFIEQDFCIRKAKGENQYYQTCGEGTARVEWQSNLNGLLQFGVIGDEFATVIPVDAKFEDVQINGGVVVASGKAIPQLSEPICMGTDGRMDSVKERKSDIKTGALLLNQILNQTFVVRILTSRFGGATLDDVRDLMFKVQVLNLSDKGLELKYQVLSKRGGNRN